MGGPSGSRSEWHPWQQEEASGRVRVGFLLLLVVWEGGLGKFIFSFQESRNFKSYSELCGLPQFLSWLGKIPGRLFFCFVNFWVVSNCGLLHGQRKNTDQMAFALPDSFSILFFCIWISFTVLWNSLFQVPTWLWHLIALFCLSVEADAF